MDRLWVPDDWRDTFFRESELTMLTSKRWARELTKILHELGTADADGRLLVDPDDVHDRVVQLTLDPAPAPGAEATADGDEADTYDPVKEGKAMAAQQKGQTARQKDLAGR